MTKKGHQKFLPRKWKFFPKNVIQKSWVREKIFSVPPTSAPGLRHCVQAIFTQPSRSTGGGGGGGVGGRGLRGGDEWGGRGRRGWGSGVHPPQAMIHFPPVADFPPISKNVFGSVGNFSNLAFPPIFYFHQPKFLKTFF